MSKALENTLEKLKHDRQMAAQSKQWEGKAHYFSPKTAEKWDAPEHLMRFESNVGPEMRRVVTEYGYSLSRELDMKSAEQVLQERKTRAKFSNWKDPSQSRLTSFDEAFKKDDTFEETKKRRGLWGWLMGR